MAIGTTVFDAFPEAIVRDWQIAQMAYSTITGNSLDEDSAITIDVIIDEASSTEPNPSPNAQNAHSDILLYVRPEQLPTLDIAELTASYAMRNSMTGKLYSIIEAGIGKNQETGVMEHVELIVRQTGEA